MRLFYFHEIGSPVVKLCLVGTEANFQSQRQPSTSQMKYKPFILGNWTKILEANN